MSKIPENTLDILERNIQKLKDSEEPLTLPDMKRLEMLVNIRRILIANGTDVVSTVEKHEDISDDEILEALKSPEEPIFLPKMKGRKQILEHLQKKKAD